jgi:hypothetical protein
MRRWFQSLTTALAAVALVTATTVASLIGLNAECNGSASECPRSDAYRAGLLAMPCAALVLLLGGTVWSIRKRTLRPLVVAEAAVLAVEALVDATLNTPDIGTVVLLAFATVIGGAALRQST